MTFIQHDRLKTTTIDIANYKEPTYAVTRFHCGHLVCDMSLISYTKATDDELTMNNEQLVVLVIAILIMVHVEGV